MERVSVRRLSHDTAGVLALVEHGDSVEITKNGVPIARLEPLTPDPLADLVARGVVRPATYDVTWPLPAPADLPDVPDSADVLADLRADRL